MDLWSQPEAPQTVNKYFGSYKKKIWEQGSIQAGSRDLWPWITHLEKVSACSTSGERVTGIFGTTGRLHFLVPCQLGGAMWLVPTNETWVEVTPVTSRPKCWIAGAFPWDSVFPRPGGHVLRRQPAGGRVPRPWSGVWKTVLTIHVRLCLNEIHIFLYFATGFNLNSIILDLLPIQ